MEVQKCLQFIIINAINMDFSFCYSSVLWDIICALNKSLMFLEQHESQ